MKQAYFAFWFFESYPLMYRPSHLPSLRFRIFSPLRGIIFTPFVLTTKLTPNGIKMRSCKSWWWPNFCQVEHIFDLFSDIIQADLTSCFTFGRINSDRIHRIYFCDGYILRKKAFPRTWLERELSFLLYILVSLLSVAGIFLLCANLPCILSFNAICLKILPYCIYKCNLHLSLVVAFLGIIYNEK